MSRLSLAMALVSVLFAFSACAGGCRTGTRTSGTPAASQVDLESTRDTRSQEASARAKDSLRSGQLDKAAAEAREALRHHAQNIEALLVLAELYRGQGKHELVLATTDAILGLESVKPEEKSQAYNLMGFACLQAGSSFEAFEHFKHAAELDEGNASAWNNLGVQYMWRDNTDVAEACLTYALEVDPEFSEARLNLGAAQRANGKLGEAEASYLEVAKARPDWAEVHFNLGVLYLDAKQVRDLDEATKLRAAVKAFATYKSLVVEGNSSAQRSENQHAPVDAQGEGPVSPARADLYIEMARRGIASDESEGLDSAAHQPQP